MEAMMSRNSFLNNIRLIQGGMGVYVSNWKLAKSVASTKPGKVAGTISGTALDSVYVRLLQLGDPGGYIKRAFQAFDLKFKTNIASEIYKSYYIPFGKRPEERFQGTPMTKLRFSDGSVELPLGEPNRKANYELKIDEKLIKLLIVSGFAETWLAKESHKGLIFMNFLHKIEIPLVYTLYGSMLADIDGVIVGAGNPDGLPALCQKLADHESVQTELNVLYKESGEKFHLVFNPKELENGILTKQSLKKPAFLAIVSLEDLATSLSNSSSMPPDGLIIENFRAGGHNANPVEGIFKKDELGQPIYGEKDVVNLEKIKKTNLPFWLGGGFGSQLKLKEALQSGATGIQVGSLFAMAEESGMKSEHKDAIFKSFRDKKSDKDIVRTTMYSPTGFSFKVAILDGTLSDTTVYENRHRVCDVGLLQQIGLTKPDNSGKRRLFQRCPAAPLNMYLKNRGIQRNTEDKRCLCNGLLSAAGFPQIHKNGKITEEPSIVTIGENLEEIRRLSRNGQISYSVRDAIDYILGKEYAEIPIPKEAVA